VSTAAPQAFEWGRGYPEVLGVITKMSKYAAKVWLVLVSVFVCYFLFQTRDVLALPIINVLALPIIITVLTAITGWALYRIFWYEIE
jgi:hypothetical protein